MLTHKVMVRLACCMALLVSSFCSLDPLTVEEPLVICTAPRPESKPPNASRFGIFDTRFYSNYSRYLDSLSLLLGAEPGYALWFQHFDDPFPAGTVSKNAARGIKTVISMSISSLRISVERNDTLLREIADGKWDTVLTAFASQAALTSETIFLRFGYEMNGTWFPWGGKPADFRAAWNHARHIFKLAGGANVAWVFSPGVLFGTMSFDRDLAPYYPGDSTVDIVGLDGYNFGNITDQWNSRHYWQDFRTIFGRSLLAVRSFDKPLWISEVGCPTDPRRREWLRELLQFMDNNPCVEAFFWFNANKSGEPDFRIESDEASLEVMREWLGDGRSKTSPPSATSPTARRRVS